MEIKLSLVAIIFLQANIRDLQTQLLRDINYIHLKYVLHFFPSKAYSSFKSITNKAEIYISCEARNLVKLIQTYRYPSVLRSVRILSVVQFCVRLHERTIKASDFRFAAKRRH